MKLPKDKKVYVIGMSGIEEELKEEGIAYIGGTVRPLHESHRHMNRDEALVGNEPGPGR